MIYAVDALSAHASKIILNCIAKWGGRNRVRSVVFQWDEAVRTAVRTPKRSAAHAHNHVI